MQYEKPDMEVILFDSGSVRTDDLIVVSNGDGDATNFGELFPGSN